MAYQAVIEARKAAEKYWDKDREVVRLAFQMISEAEERKEARK